MLFHDRGIEICKTCKYVLCWQYVDITSSFIGFGVGGVASSRTDFQVQTTMFDLDMVDDRATTLERLLNTLGLRLAHVVVVVPSVIVMGS